MKENVWILTLLLFPVLGSYGANRSDPQLDQPSEIELKVNADGNFQLNARQVSLRRIFERIQRNTQTVLNYSSVPEVSTTVSCSGTIVELMKCVLGGTNNLMMRYGEETIETANAAVPAEIWILGAGDNPMTAESEPGESKPCGPPVNRSGQEPGWNFLGKKVTLSEPERDALLAQMRSQDLAVRIGAITRLARVENDGEVLDSLHEALFDEHPSIRAQAVSTLAIQKVSGVDQILRQAVLDSDAEVRLMAVSNAGADESLLLTAAEDADPNVRLFANMKLKQLYNQDTGGRQ